MIYLGADHGGYHLKEKVKQWLTEWGEKYEDYGNREYDENDDYPKYAFEVAKKVAENDQDGAKGILLCRSAVGMVIAANKIKGARGAAVYDEQMARLSREHNNANIIGLSGDRLNEEEAKQIIRVFLETKFSEEERHRRRVVQIKDYEEKRERPRSY